VASQAKNTTKMADGMRVKLPALLETRSGPKSATANTTSQITAMASDGHISGTKARVRGRPPVMASEGTAATVNTSFRHKASRADASIASVRVRALAGAKYGSVDLDEKEQRRRSC
jgi:hypothetical protein